MSNECNDTQICEMVITGTVPKINSPIYVQKCYFNSTLKFHNIEHNKMQQTCQYF